MVTVEQGLSGRSDADAPCWQDPFNEDPSTEEIDATTRRRLMRLLLLAAATGARFEREGNRDAALPWLLSPQNVFDGETALEAAGDLRPFVRAMLLHTPGAPLALEAGADELDEMVDWNDVTVLSAGMGLRGAADLLGGERHPPGDRPDRRTDHIYRRIVANWLGRHRLFSCSLIRVDRGSRIKVFVAGLARDERDFRSRLFERFGAIAALSGDVRTGFDQYDPIAVSLVSEEVADWLAMIAAMPEAVGDGGLDLVIEQRLSA